MGVARIPNDFTSFFPPAEARLFLDMAYVFLREIALFFFRAAFSRLFSVVGRSCAHGKRFRKLGPLRTGTMSFFPPELSAVGDFIKVCGKVFNHNCEQRWLRPSIHHTSGGDYFVLNFCNRQNDSSCCVVNYIMICASNCIEFIGIVQICYSWRRVLSGKIFA